MPRLEESTADCSGYSRTKEIWFFANSSKARLQIPLLRLPGSMNSEPVEKGCPGLLSSRHGHPNRLSQSDLTDREWAQVRRFIPAPKPGGRPAKYDRREIVNALLYVTRTGCQWRALPHDLPPWADRVLVLPHLEEGRDLRPPARRAARRPAAGRGPAAAALGGDPRQPVGQDDRKRGPRGYDAGKKVNGRKRHILVDTLGLILVGGRPRRRRPGPRRGRSWCSSRSAPVQPAAADLGRRDLQRRDRRLGARPAAAGTSSGWRSCKRPGADGFEVLPFRWGWSGPSPGWAGAAG